MAEFCFYFADETKNSSHYNKKTNSLNDIELIVKDSENSKLNDKYMVAAAKPLESFSKMGVNEIEFM